MRRAISEFVFVAAFLIFILTGCYFEPVDLGTLPGGANSWAHDINEKGVVVGASETSSGQTHATRWNLDGSIDDLGTLGGANSWAYGINNLGIVVGESETAKGEMHAFFTFGDAMVSLGPGVARAINDDLWITGNGVVWKNSPVSERLDDHPAKQPFAYDISESGQIGGYYAFCDGVFRWDDGVMHDYPHSGVGFVNCTDRAYGINESGWLAGQGYFKPADADGDLFIWASLFRPNGIKVLDHFEESIGYDINNFGWIVGTATTRDVDEPFVWYTSQGLSQLLPTLGGATGEARRVNEYGHIVGWSAKPNGRIHATLWDPRNSGARREEGATTRRLAFSE